MRKRKAGMGKKRTVLSAAGWLLCAAMLLAGCVAGEKNTNLDEQSAAGPAGIIGMEQEEESTRSFKQQIAQKLYEIAEGYLNGEKKELPDGFYKAISFLGYELIEEYYQKLLEEMNEW